MARRLNGTSYNALDNTNKTIVESNYQSRVISTSLRNDPKAFKQGHSVNTSDTDFRNETEHSASGTEYHQETTSQEHYDSQSKNRSDVENTSQSHYESGTESGLDIYKGYTAKKEKDKIYTAPVYSFDMDLDPDQESLDTPCSIADRIIHQMSVCYDKDLECMNSQVPALHKLVYSEILVREIKNHSVRECFLENGGLVVMSQWLEKTKDGSFPWYTLLNSILDVIEGLPIQVEHLRQSELGKIIKRIKKHWADDSIKKRCADILDKWYRLIFDTDIGYDQSGEYESQYRKYKEDRIREIRDIRGAKDDFDAKKRNLKELIKLKNADKDKAYVPERNNFDFTIRPGNMVNKALSSEAMKPDNVKADIMKKILSMQKNLTKTRKYL